MIERILEKRGLDYKKTGSYIQLSCLNPEHEDKNPSMFINEFTGWANCKSCGYSANIYTLFNEKANWLQIKKEKFREKLRKTAFESNNLDIPEGAVFFETGFRGISSETIRKFQAFQTSEFPGYLFFPLRNASGKIVNFIGRDTTGVRKPKYLFMHETPVVMSPYSNSYHGSIILVEGWFDVLNLYDKGITNVRSIFGTVTFHKEHVEKLKFEGVDEVFIMLDSDEAGMSGAREIKEMLEAEYITAKIVKLPTGTDPGDMSKESVLKLKEQLYGVSRNRRNKTE
tara:strand:- start:2897 stop:3748 length:852 start_codon:yes stop_codon:yes gene_type:complete